MSNIVSDLTAVAANPTELVKRVSELEEGRRGNSERVLRFTPRGHSISDGSPGFTVSMQWYFVKLRDCGTAGRLGSMFGFAMAAVASIGSTGRQFSMTAGAV